MKTIIVPVDFSDTSASALRFGAFLAEVMDLDLSVAHVFDANFSFAQAISTGAMLAEKERLAKQLSDFVERHVYPVLSTFQGNLTTLPAINTTVYEGFPSGIIRTLSEREDTAMMVMGGIGAGQRSTPPGLFGGVARSLALGGSCPVILIPPGYGYPEVNSLSIAFGDTEDIRQMGGMLRRLIKVLRPEVSFVHVESTDSAKELMNDESFLEMALGVDFPSYTFSYHSLPPGPVVKRLLKFVNQEKVGMLVLGGKRRHFWQALFAGSSLKPLINRCEVPLLIIPLGMPTDGQVGHQKSDQE
jgi:nucleotide-binding universal stress UspA family protein